MHCLAQGLSAKFLHIRRWLRAGFPHTRTSMQRTSLHSPSAPLPHSQQHINRNVHLGEMGLRIYLIPGQPGPRDHSWAGQSCLHYNHNKTVLQRGLAPRSKGKARVELSNAFFPKKMFVLSDVNILCISARLWLQVGSPNPEVWGSVSAALFHLGSVGCACCLRGLWSVTSPPQGSRGREAGSRADCSQPASMQLAGSLHTESVTGQIIARSRKGNRNIQCQQFTKYDSRLVWEQGPDNALFPCQFPLC